MQWELEGWRFQSPHTTDRKEAAWRWRPETNSEDEGNDKDEAYDDKLKTCEKKGCFKSTGDGASKRARLQ